MLQYYHHQSPLSCHPCSKQRRRKKKNQILNSIIVYTSHLSAWPSAQWFHNSLTDLITKTILIYRNFYAFQDIFLIRHKIWFFLFFFFFYLNKKNDHDIFYDSLSISKAHKAIIRQCLQQQQQPSLSPKISGRL